MSEEFVFPHDGVCIRVPTGYFANGVDYSNEMKERSVKEPLLRKIVAFLFAYDYLDRTENIMDAGAYIGDNAIPWSVNITGKVYAIDPCRYNVAFIRETALQNDASKVVSIQTVLSDGRQTVYTNEENMHHVSCTEINTGRNAMETTTIDALYMDSVIDNIGLIHLDVEGFEYKVIRGADRVLEIFRPVVIWENHIEKEPTHVIIDHLSGSYHTYMINERLDGCFPDCRNFISFPKHMNHRAIVAHINAAFSSIMPDNRACPSQPDLLVVF